jgi:hypothetical protein
MTFVPDDFDVPLELRAQRFVLRPLRIEHNERDYDAWMSSIGHIRATPGFETETWPREMSLDDNAADLARHEEHFATRRGFTYTVLDPSAAEVLGCVYIYPGTNPNTASVRSWVRASHAELDRELYAAVRGWLERDWPFASVEYAPRE